MQCNRKCLECKFSDCIVDDVDELDEYIAHLTDKEVMDIHPDISTSVYKYNHSEKRKATSKRYLESEKGKATHERSWKNYAANHPDRVRAKSRLYYMRHREEILEKARQKRKAVRNDNT